MKPLMLAAMSLAIAALTPGAVAHAQTTTEAAKADGKAFARDKAAAAQDAATTRPDAERVPNFGVVPSQSGYFDDPDRMSREAASQARSVLLMRTLQVMRRVQLYAVASLHATRERVPGESMLDRRASDLQVVHRILVVGSGS